MAKRWVRLLCLLFGLAGLSTGSQALKVIQGNAPEAAEEDKPMFQPPRTHDDQTIKLEKTDRLLFDRSFCENKSFKLLEIEEQLSSRSDTNYRGTSSTGACQRIEVI